MKMATNKVKRNTQNASTTYWVRTQLSNNFMADPIASLTEPVKYATS